MTFKVDKSTTLMARGAGKAQQQAEAKGAAGVKFADFVKPGVGVEVHYKDVGGVLMATDVHSGLPPTEGSVPAESAGGSARGTISAIGNSSVTIKADDKDWTFSVDSEDDGGGPGPRHHQPAVQGAGQVADGHGPAGRERSGRRVLQGRRRREAGERDPRDREGGEVKTRAAPQHQGPAPGTDAAGTAAGRSGRACVRRC